MDKKPTEKCVELLDTIMLNDGVFDYETAMELLLEMRDKQKIDTLAYINLVDACNKREIDGHYRNSLIYKRALEDELKGRG